MLPFGRIVPMLPQASQLFDAEGWAYEAKLDGIRALAFVDASGGVRLQNRRLREMTHAYPDVVAAVADAVRGPAVIDGEIVALVDGVPRFRRLMTREVADTAKAGRLAREVPATFYAFDALWAGDRDLRRCALADRRGALADLLRSVAVPVSPWLPGSGEDVFAASVAAGFEGIVAKHVASAYHEGRSPDWRKVKRVEEVDALIGGWTEGTGRRAGSVGSLVLGLWTPAGLRPIGRVGSGLSASDLADLLPKLRGLAREESPFSTPVEGRCHWIEPVLVAHVEYQEATEGGRLRGPVFKGLRRDKVPEACTFASELPGLA